MRVKLIRSVDGKFGTYPSDTWLDAFEDEGFIFVGMPGVPQMKGKRVARSNIKEYDKTNNSQQVNVPELRPSDTVILQT